MESFVLTCCSTADKPQSFFDERNIHYVSFHFTMDGKEYPDDLGKSMSFSDFYARMDKGASPITSQVNAKEFTAFWEPFLQAGQDVLHVTLSSGISGVSNSANIAKTELSEKYPERKIIVIDSLGASSGYGQLMDDLADLRDEGKTIDEIAAWAEENKLRLHHWFFSTDLSAYQRGGRISNASAKIGTLLSICPLLNMDDKGRLIPRRKIRTKRKVIIELVKMMEEHAQNGADYQGKCSISHSDCLEDAQKVRDLVVEKFPQLKDKVDINSVGTVIGAHTGPGTVALFFMGDLRQE